MQSRPLRRPEAVQRLAYSERDMDPNRIHSEHEFATETGERRRARRQTTRGRIVLNVETHRLEGRADNVSQSGILFFSDGDLRVTVEIEDAEGTRRRTGRVVRGQRMRGERFGWAVEFDPE
jgi:hypothetical protein